MVIIALTVKWGKKLLLQWSFETLLPQSINRPSAIPEGTKMKIAKQSRHYSTWNYRVHRHRIYLKVNEGRKLLWRFIIWMISKEKQLSKGNRWWKISKPICDQNKTDKIYWERELFSSTYAEAVLVVCELLITIIFNTVTITRITTSRVETKRLHWRRYYRRSGSFISKQTLCYNVHWNDLFIDSQVVWQIGKANLVNNHLCSICRTAPLTCTMNTPDACVRD